MVMDCIVVKSLKKSFGSLRAVDDIGFEVKEGERFAFLGVNGAGKSTTIAMICGTLQKDSGEILVNGVSVDSDAMQIKQEIGIVFQNSVLDKKLSVLENLKMRAGMYGIFGEQFKKRLKYITKKFDLEDILSRPVGQLSGGQRRRADIARALIHNPKILILDEPTTGLDPATRKLVWKVVDDMQKESNLTVFLTTHYMEEAATANRIMIIDKGKIIASGTPVELKNKFTADSLYIYGKKASEIKKLGLEYEKIPEGFKVELPSLRKATEFMIKYPELFDDFEIIKGRMDDVFINATGRKEI